MTAADIDRIAMSNELFILAGRYVTEAQLTEDDSAEGMLRAARHLSELGRQILGQGDLEVADAFARTAALSLELIEEARRASWRLGHHCGRCRRI